MYLQFFHLFGYPPVNVSVPSFAQSVTICFVMQVLYLHSVDLGSLSMDHTTFPRVRCFTYDQLRAIAADSSYPGSCLNSIGTSCMPKVSPGYSLYSMVCLIAIFLVRF
jgi:hypothetical protein